MPREAYETFFSNPSKYWLTGAGISQWSSQKMRQSGTINSWHIRIMYFSCNTIDWCMNVLNWNKLLQNKTTKKNLGSKLLNFSDQKGTGSLTILGHKQPNIQSSKPLSRFINRTPISCNVRWVKFEFYLFIYGVCKHMTF